MELNDKHLVAYATSITLVDHEGWLKQGEKGGLKRWCILKGNLLFYFEKRFDMKPIGVIILEGCKIELADPDFQFSFKLLFLPFGNKSYILEAESHAAMCQWMKALRVASYDSMKLKVSDLQRQLDEIKTNPSHNNTSTSYELAGHVLNIDRHGQLYDSTPFENIENARTTSVSLYEAGPYTKFDSLSYFDERNAANELLKLLHHFANPMKNNFGATTKQEFSWGYFKEDFNNFTTNLKIICEKAIQIFKKEPRLLVIESPAYILGDIHGNFPDIIVFEQVFWKTGPRLCPYSIVFLGDYVDRGNYSCEVVAYLFAQKVMNPRKFFLIRGNHEDRIVQKNFTFYRECQEKFKKDGDIIWETINRVFDVLPIAGLIDKTIFVCHGGIPPPWICPSIEAINNVKCPLERPSQDSFIAWEIMWNDPVMQDQIPPDMVQMGNRQGFTYNTRRGTGHCFTSAALDVFLSVNGLSHVIRAHEVKSIGFQIQQGGKLLTVFSSSGYCGGVNEAACILVEGQKIRIIRVNTN